MTMPENCQADKLGTDSQGNRVTAATDAAGPQVIVVGENVHLLSYPLRDHAAAVALGKRVVAEGYEIHDKWYDLKKGGVGLNMFAVFGGEFRTPSYDGLAREVSDMDPDEIKKVLKKD